MVCPSVFPTCIQPRGEGDCLKPYVKQVEEDVLIHREERDLKQGHDEELYRAGFAQDGPKGNAHRTHTEISID